MQNPNKSSTNKNKPPSIVSRVLVSLVLILLLVGSGFFFARIWQQEAFNIDSKPPKTKTEVQNGTRVVILNYTFTVENYVPLRDFTAYPTVLIHNSTHDIIEQLNFTQQTPLAKLGIKIDSWEVRRSYGDKELSRPRIEVDPTYFPMLPTEGMSKTTLIINWRYNITETVASAALLYSAEPNPVVRTIARQNVMSNNILIALESAVLPYLFFVASGFIFSFYVFQSGKLMNDYGVLSKFPEDYQKAGASEKKEMENSLRNIVAFPKRVGRGWRLLFGLSIFVIKALVNNSCKEHDEGLASYKPKIAPFRRESLSGIFSKGTKSTFEKIEDTLPELKTIGIVVAALTGVGITFSFNVGAAAPFLYTLALFYFFFNLGSIFQFVIKSNRDRYWTLAVIFLAIFLILLPKIVDILRLAT